MKNLKEKNIRNILTIGEVNKGKSTLANILSDSDYFYKNNSTIRNQEIRSKEFEEKWLKYRVIDTGGIREKDINLKLISTNDEGLEKLAKFIQLTREGFNQIFLVINSGFTINKKWMAFYKLLKTTIFDNKIDDYITIVRTNFPDFNKKEVYQKERIVIHNIFQNHLSISSDKIIFIDNSHSEKRKDIQNLSREFLLKHLSTCQNIYQPKNLSKLNEIQSILSIIIPFETV